MFSDTLFLSTFNIAILLIALIGMLVCIVFLIELIKGESSDLDFVRYFTVLNKRVKIFKKQHPDFNLRFNGNCIKACDIESYNQKHPDNQININEHFLDSQMYFDVKNGTYSNYYKFLPSSIDAGLAKVSPFVNL